MTPPGSTHEPRRATSAPSSTAPDAPVAAQQNSDVFLDRVSTIAGVGGWEIDLHTGQLTWSAETYRIHGVPADFMPTLDGAIDFYAPEARPLIRAALDNGIKTGEGWDLELPFIQANGTRIWVRAVGSVTFEQNTPVRISGAFQDITDRINQHNALQQARDRLALATDCGGIGIWEWDVRKNEMLWDDWMYRLYGTTREENFRTYDLWATHLHPDDRADTEKAVQDALEGTAPFNLDFRIIWRDGSIHYIRAFGRVSRDDSGNAVRMIGTNWDVTLERRLADELAQSANAEQARLAAIVASSSDAIIGKTMTGVITDWNRAAERMFGYKAEEAIGRTVMELIVPPDRRTEEIGILARVTLGETVEHFSTRRQRRDGSFVDASVAVSPIRAADGRVIGAAKILRDMSLERELEARLHALNASLEQQIAERTQQIASMAVLQSAIFDSANYAIIAGDENCTLTIFNRAAETMLGYSAAEMIGATPSAFHDEREVALRAAELSIELGHPVAPGVAVFTLKPSLGHDDAREWTYIRKDGTRLPVWLSVSALRNDAGKIFGFVGIAIDLTERKHAESEMRQLNQQLIAARQIAEAESRAKSEFVSNMSHEIRTPMNAILGFSRLLQDLPLAEQERSFAAKIQVSAQSLLGIINDILDFSKIEAGKLELEQQRFSLITVLHGVSAVIAGHAWAKNVEPVITIAPDVPLDLVDDATRVQQILLNLLGNAVKFTERGEVVLSIRKGAEESTRIMLTFSVRDTGIGIPLKAQKNLFQAFSQADSSTNRKYGGTGLGLAICQRLVELMQGTLTLVSEEGKGSDFSFTAWFEKSDPIDRRSVEPRAAMENLTVLIVDDNDSARHSLAQICRSFNWRPLEAASGPEALRLLRGKTRGGRADILLVDRWMQEESGLDLVRQARADPTINLPPAVLMVRDYDNERYRPLPEDLPVAAVIAKPITSSMIFDVVAEIRDGKVIERRDSIVPLSGRLAGMRLLVVEDNQINQDFLSAVLLRSGAQMEAARDGNEAITALRRHGAGFDAVLMDVQMPGMDGYETTEVIRNELGLHTLPIIALTANVGEADRQRALNAGMNAHVGKPIDVDHMIAVLLQEVAGFDAGLQPVASEMPSYGFAALKASLPNIDIAAVESRFGDDHEEFIRLLRRFDHAHRDIGGELHGLLAAKQPQQAEKLLHSLRGVAGNLGAMTIARRALALENAIAAERTTELPDLLSAVTEAYDMVSAELSALPVDATSLPPPVSIDTARLIEKLQGFAALLRANDLAALADFKTLHANVMAFDGSAAAEILAALDSLSFAAAAGIVLDLIKRARVEVGNGR